MAFPNSQVLVLNRHWQPVHICGGRRALSLLVLGHALVVGTDGERSFMTHDVGSWLRESMEYAGPDVVRGVNHQFRIPQVIVLSQYDRIPRLEVKFSRHTVFERDKHVCQYCAQRYDPRELNIDHVIPKDKGGKTTWENVVCSCISCNSRKANKLPAQAGMFPLNEPKRPRWRPFYGSGAPRRLAHPSWRSFLEIAAEEVVMST
jgi:5-methylcytosine-specific restriction endonuclease McrA